MTTGLSALVAEHPLLADLPGDAVEQVAGCARNIVWRTGELLVSEGEQADTFYLVRRGRVAVEVHGPGSGRLVVDILGPGDAVGWSWLFPPYRWHFDVRATEPVGAVAVDAACLSDVLRNLDRDAWVHHIPRLMVLGNYAMQRGWRPSQVTDWFHRLFVDGYDWVMVPNVVGMSQYADGGVMATKPYAGGGAYIDRMSDYCASCRYDPKVRVGDDACPFTAGYWWFLERNRDRLAGNHRIARAMRGLDRLKDLPAVVEQERRRGSRAP